MNKKLYIGFSYTEFAWAVILRVIAVCGIVYFLINYDENPVLMGILTVISILCLLLTGDDQIIVYPDKIIQTNSSVFSLLFRSKDKIIYLSQLTHAYIEPSPRLEQSGLFIIALLKFIVSKPLGYTTKATSIFFQYYEGNLQTLETRLGHKAVVKIVAVVNELINAPVPTSGDKL